MIRGILEPGLSHLMSRMSRTYLDTMRMAGKVSIDPKNAVLKRKCDPEMMTGYSKDVFKQLPGKIMFGNGISWTCLISLDLKNDDPI